MVRRLFILIILALFPLCGAAAQESVGLGSVVAGPEAPPAIVESDTDPIEAALEAMSLEQKIAQLMFVTFESGHNPSSTERRLLKGYTPGGVFLPAVTSPKSFEGYVRDLRANPVEAQHKIPMLIGTNFHGLAAQRHPKTPYSPLPPLLALGASHDEAKMAAAAEVVARYVDVLGVGVHFGPSLSLSSRLSGADTGYDYFGEDPELAAMGARAFGRTFEQHGINWMPMGFPGGGGNRKDAGPPVLVTPRSVLDGIDLLPFREAIAAGAGFMHVGNVLVPTLESEAVPASVSYAVLTKLLREDLGFAGITVAGPMDDPNLTRYYTGPNAPIRALMAGADMVWWGTPGPRAEQFVGQLAVAVEQGDVPESVIDERVRHVLTVKQDLGLLEKPLPRQRDIEKLIREQGKAATALALEEAGIVVAKLTPGLLPIGNEHSAPVGVTGVIGVPELYYALDEEKIEPLARYNIATAKHGKQVYGFELDRLLRGAAGTRTLICLFRADVHGATQREILRRFKDLGTKIVTVLFGVPEDIDKYLENSDALIVLLRPPDQTPGASIQALANVLLGRGSIRMLKPTRGLQVAVGEPISFDISSIAVTPVARLPINASPSLPAGTGFSFPARIEKRKVRWYFGDETDASGPVAEHAYANPGTYSLRVEVIEGGRAIAEGAYTIVVSETT